MTRTRFIRIILILGLCVVTPIASAAIIGKYYTPTKADRGYKIRVGVKATNADGTSRRVYSKWSPPVRNVG